MSMRRILFTCLAVSICALNSAFAQNLGALSDDQKPQHLLPATEFLNYLSSGNSNTPVTAAQDQRPANIGTGQGHDSELWYGYWGSYYPYYYPSYYYPYYGYGYGYGGYGYGYPYYWYSNEQGANPGVTVDHSRMTNHVADDANTVRDAAHVPVVCFASDEAGTWYAQADLASNVSKSQASANSECLASGGNCLQNLGCAIAYK